MMMIQQYMSAPAEHYATSDWQLSIPVEEKLSSYIQCLENSLRSIIGPGNITRQDEEMFPQGSDLNSNPDFNFRLISLAILDFYKMEYCSHI